MSSPMPLPPLVRLFGVAALAYCGFGGGQILGADDDEVLPLPSWPKETAPSVAFPLGGPLLPSDPSFSEADGVQAPLKTPDSFLFFIPKGSLVMKPGSETVPAAATAPLVDVGPDFLARCERQDPDDRLYDPGTVLSETPAEALRRLLSYHAEEAATSSSFLLLEENQKLPAGSDLARLGAGRLLQGHHCLAVYPVGQPNRARLFMSHEITSAVPRDYLKGLVRACVDDALQATEPVEQLQRFATQLSIRIIWMERAYPAVFAPPSEPVLAAATLASPVRAIPSAELLPEVTRITPTEPTASLLRLLPAAWQPYLAHAAWGLGGTSVSCLAGVVLVRFLRRRRKQVIWMLPDSEHTPRLGGSHCGGGGSWIHYR